MCPPWLGCCVRLAGLVSGLVSHLVWDAVSASLVLSFSCLRSCLRSCLPSWLGCRVRLAGLSPVLSPSLSPIWSGVLCPPPWSCLSLVSGLVSQLLSLFCLVACLSSGMLCLPPLGLSFSCLWSCLPACLPSGLGCCVCLAGLVFLLSAVLSPALSAILAGMLCPPGWAVSGLVSQLVSHLVWDAVSASLVLSFSCLRSCLRCVRLAGLSPVLSPSLSPIWSGMLCPPPWSCLSLVSGLVSQLVFVLSRSLSFIWDAVSAPPGLVFFLSLVLSPMLCLPSWLVSQPSFCLRSFVPSCFPAGLVCPCSGLVSKISCAICATVWGLRWCNLFLVSGLVSQLVSHLVWDAVSASLALSFSCLRSCLRPCLPSWLGCCCLRCVRLAGLSPVLSPSLSPIWSGMLCPPPWSCLSLVSGLVSQLVFVLSRSLSFIWDAVSAPPGLVFFLSLVLSPMLCLPSWLVSQPSFCLRSFVPSCFPAGLVCPCSGLVSKISCAICATVWGLRWCNLFLVSGLVSQLVSHLVWDAVSASLALSFSCLRSCLRPCLPSWLGCCCLRCVRLAGLSPVLSPSLSPIWSGMLCPPPWSCLSLVSGLVSQLLSLFCLVACLSSGMLCLPPLGLSFSCLWSCLRCCVCLLGSSPSPACLRSFVPSCFPAGLVCPCSGLVSKISCAICATVWGLRWCNFLNIFFMFLFLFLKPNFSCQMFENLMPFKQKINQNPSKPKSLLLGTYRTNVSWNNLFRTSSTSAIYHQYPEHCWLFLTFTTPGQLSPKLLYASPRNRVGDVVMWRGFFWDIPKLQHGTHH